MALYYRLPGFVAIFAILVYASITFALFRLIPITLTLPGIAGFLLSTGSALDANILIFERLKEELRSGQTMRQAVKLGWERAWPSIRDSNIATLITCVILFWFGNTFGATIVKGFSLTLALGMAVSLFTAILVTRTVLGLVLEYFKPTNYARWFGI
jgi:preprotein translocase subunit SecD